MGVGGSSTNYCIEVCSRASNYTGPELAAIFHELMVKGYQVEIRLDCLVIIEPSMKKEFEETADDLLEELHIDCPDFNVDEVFYITKNRKWEAKK
jgi:hypothetical protein